jgi:SAM-dependent methyltransferase
MHSRELGLVLAQQLLDVQDLHYGLWDEDLELKLANLPAAQQRYNDMLLAQLPSPEREVRVLDIGCGAGNLLRQLVDRGYRAEGVIPAKDLCEATRRRLAGCAGQTRVFECRFEDFPIGERSAYYDVALFSESFQYVSPRTSLPILQAILKPGGVLLISDFFKTDNVGDGGVGDGSFGGGHPLRDFYAAMQRTPFVRVKDEDITPRISPNLELLNDLLMNRLKPATATLGTYLQSRYPWIASLALALMRKKVDRLNQKYFSGHRCRAVFERYKTYRLLLYRLP